MGNIKKYNGDGWDVIATNNSRNIVVDDLSVNDSEKTSLNNILTKHNSDIDLLKKNVAWLALHGGGGSGGSGGGVNSSEATCKIKVNGKDEGETDKIKISKNENIIIVFSNFSSNARNSWNVVISLDGKIIRNRYVSVNNNTIILNYEDIINNSSNLNLTLTINAYYTDEFKGIYGSVNYTSSIFVNTCELLVDTTISVNINSINSTYVTYKYKVPIPGNYTLNIDIKKDNENFNTISENYVINSLESEIKIELIELLGNIFVDDIEYGSYNVISSLIYEDDNTLYGSIKHDIIIITEEIMISAPLMSLDKDNPYQINKNGSLYCEYIALVYNISSFDSTYYVKYNGNFEEIATTYNHKFGETVKDYIPLNKGSWGVVTEEGEVLEVKLSINTSSNKKAEKIFYYKIVNDNGAYIEFRETSKFSNIVIFDATTTTNRDYIYELSSNGSEYKNLSNKIIIKNGNILSTWTADSETHQPYLRISNGAYGVLDEYFEWESNNKVNNSKLDYFIDNINSIGNIHRCNFTISICFKQDYHSDDDRTVFAFSHVDNENEISDGICINTHGVYVNKDLAFPIVDNLLNNIVITCEYDDNEYTHKVKAYLNGVLTYVNYNINNLFLSSYEFLPRITFGGLCVFDSNGDIEKVINLCDMNLYYFNITKKPLNEFDIMVDYLNNLARCNYTTNHTPNYTFLSDELQRNFCEQGSGGSITNCAIYNISGDTFNFSSFFKSTATGDYVLNDEWIINSKEYIGIPIMYFDCSTTTNWSFENFISNASSDPNSLKIDNVTVQYLDPTRENTSLIKIAGCNISPQGTSTMADKIKNLNIEVPFNSMFMPIPEWLPEQIYTLKADIVDSSHSNNAAIGKFINNVLTDIDFLPLDNNARNNITDTYFYKNQCNDEIRKKLKVKITVEGFPILLFIKFYGDTAPTALGIYSFNLGRDSVRNLGFEKIEEVLDEYNEQFLVDHFPFFKENVNYNTNKNNTGYWIESKATFSITNFSELENNPIESLGKLNASQCEFWQKDGSVIDSLFETRYPDSSTKPSKIANFVNFNNYIVQLPIEGRYKTNVAGGVSMSDINGSFDAYIYDGANYIKDGDNKHEMVKDLNDILPPNEYFNVDSSYGYFVVALLFGLIDNFGKNLTFRSWAIPNTDKFGEYFFGFYDLDTALGGDNQGKLTIKPFTLLKEIYNEKQNDDDEFGIATETFLDEKEVNCTTISARHNKLWLSLDTKFMRKKINSTDETSLYSTYWFTLRQKLDKYVKEFNSENNTAYDNFYTFFMEEYYKKQLEKCGVLLLNYDYKVKYLLDAREEKIETDSATLSKLHGKKYEYCYNWFREHILAMDSYFYWRDSNDLEPTIKNTDAEVNNDLTNKVYKTPYYIPLKTNSSLIMHGAVGDSYKYFCFMSKNTKTNLPMGGNNSNSVVNWYMSHANYVTDIGDENITLKDVSINIFGDQGDGYCSLTELNLSGCQKLSSDFKMYSFERKEISELRKIDFSFAKCENNSFTFSLALQNNNNNSTKYKKLTHINIQNSECISDIAIPSVPLNELIVSHSKITEFNLIKQNYITNVDLTGCAKIISIKFNDCERYGDIDLTSLGNLNTIEIVNCISVHNININNCINLTNIIIENCDNVSSITINNCVKLTNGLFISGCKNLKQIDISDNENLESISIHLEEPYLKNINKFYAKNTSLTSITNNFGAELSNEWKQDGIDCRYFSEDIDVDFYNNQKVKYIYFLNDYEHPILLKNSFYNCFELERVYGHIKVKNYMPSATDIQGTFRNCYKFSIHGQLDSNTKFKNIKVLNGEKIKTVWQIILENHNESGDPRDFDFIQNKENEDIYKEEVFQDGVCVTNMYADVNQLSNTFRNTLITQFDIYYFLTTLGLKFCRDSDSFCTLNYTFSCTRDTNVNYIPNETFNWEKGNQMDRYAFYKCEKISHLYLPFTNSEQGGDFSFIYSPQTINGEFKDNGLFSPLTNLTVIAGLFTRPGVCSREVFFVGPEDGEECRIKQITITEYNWTHIFASEEFTYQGELYDITNYAKFNTFKSNLVNFIKNDYNSLRKVYGNLTNMFKPFKEKGISSLYHFIRSGTFIDYDTIKFYKCSSDVTKIANLCTSFNATYGCGEINLNEIFESESNVEKICGSFNVSNYFTDSNADIEVRVDVKLDNDYFNNTPNLKFFGQNESYPSNSNSDYSINGDGIKKFISGDKFPYEILSNLKNIEICKALFKDTECDISDNLLLPNTLFENCTNLENISYMFYNFKKNYTLTSMSLKNCPNIKILNYAFAVKNHNAAYGPKGFIPNKLLYHGHHMVSKTIIGSNSDNKPGETTYQISSGSGIYEVTVFDNYFSATTTSDLLTQIRTNYGDVYTVSIDKNNLIFNKKEIEGGEVKTFDYPSYNTSITEMNYLFEKCISLTPYEFNGLSNDFETSKSYNPFRWYVENNKWVENTNLDYTSKEKDARWVYDGANKDIISDDAIFEDTDREQITNGDYCSASNDIQTLNYCCAPDLLRYCSNISSLGIEGIFSYCGSDYGLNSGGLYGEISKPHPNRGLTGTIPSYLLMPVSSVTNLSRFFRFCRHLSSYREDGKTYLIPNNFFSYAKDINNLFSAFQGMGFVKNTEMVVFNNLSKLLDIRKIFANSEFGNKIVDDWTIQYIFINCKKITKVDGAFSICNLTESVDGNNINLTLPNVSYRYPISYGEKIKLTNVFYNKTPINKQNVKCVFYGWKYESQAYDEIIPNQNNNYFSYE